MTPDLLDAILIVGLAARLTRLATVDTIASPFRDAARSVGHRLAGTSGLVWVDELVTCPFCIGFWISAAVVGSWIGWGHTAGWQIIAGIFTVSHLVAAATVPFTLAATED